VSTRRIQQAALIILFAGITAGCSASRPVKYYVLDIPPTPASTSVPQIPVTLLVAHISAAHLYRDDRLVYGSGPVELGTYEYDRWAETPAEMMQDMILNSLRSSGSYRAVSKIASNMRGDYIIRGHLYALDEVETPTLVARFSLQLELFDPKSGLTVWSDSYSHDEPVTGSGKTKTVADVVEALDRNVHTGLAQLTANLGQYFASHPPQAPTGQ
jgi:ABC-type uncharacterized transport system auxiliary subunit